MCSMFDEGLRVQDESCWVTRRGFEGGVRNISNSLIRISVPIDELQTSMTRESSKIPEQPRLSPLRLNPSLHHLITSSKMMSSRLIRPAFAAARRTGPRAATRTYATPATADTKPPVPLFGLDGTYANALVRKVPECFGKRWK